MGVKINKGLTPLPLSPTAAISKDSTDVQDGEELKAVSITGNSTKQYKDGSTVEEATPLGEALIPSPHATVGLAVGVTRNLGNYESVKFTVSLYVPCAIDEVDIQETYEEVKGWVDLRVEQLNQEITNEMG